LNSDDFRFNTVASLKMKAIGLDLLFLEVNSLEESLAFYEGVLGLSAESVNAASDPPMATLRAGALKITLAQQLETMLRRGRGVHFFVGVEEVDSLYEEIRQKMPEVNPPADEGWGGRFITLQDPDKYRFFFVTWYEQDTRNGQAKITANEME
jgi:predicted enzyme related to lactoylglutathione lyase